MSSQETNCAPRCHLKSLSYPSAGQAVPPTTIEASALRLKFSQRPPWLWRRLPGTGPISEKYLRLYCTSIGFSGHDIRRQRLSASFQKLARSLGPWKDHPDIPVTKNISDVYQALQSPKGTPTVLLHTGEVSLSQCYEVPHGTPNTLYTQIPDDGDTVRLLIFDRKSELTLLKARLVVARLSHVPAYRALSYEWDPPEERESSASYIELNGTLTRIKPNLYHFLKRLRQFPGHLPLWIDALCINQEDKIEMSRQVTMMGDIYSKAKSVLIWLGNGGEGSDNLFRFINGTSLLQLMPYEAQMPYVDRWNPRPFLESMPSKAQTQSIRRWLQSKPTKQLLRRSYWSRAWIVQEVILAQTATLFCGEQHIEFKDAEHLLFDMKAFRGSSLNNMLYHRISVRNAKLDKKHKDHPDSRPLIASIGRLPYLMEMYQQSECLRVHDKVYSLLALCSYYKDGTNIITPDYCLTPTQLFFKAFNSFINARNPKYADILRRALKLEWQDLLESMPSHDSLACQTDHENAIYWDIEWAAKITKSASSHASTSWTHFHTDYVERHKELAGVSMFPQMESEGITLVPPHEGDIVLGLSGTSLAIIIAEEIPGPRGIAIMTGRSTQKMSLLVTIAESKDLDELMPVGDGGFPAKLCVHQFMQLLACANSDLDVGNVPYQQWSEVLEH